MKLLFITATRIGDAVLSTGVLNELIRRYPEARITVACGPLPRSLFAGFAAVERVLVMDKQPLAGHWLRLWREVAKQSWDEVVDLRRSLIPYLIRAGVRRRLPRTDASVHRAAFLPRVLGIDEVLPPVVPVPEAHAGGAALLLPGDRPTLAVAPVAARSDKTWPAARFAALLARLLSPSGRCADWRLLVVAGAGDEAAVDAVAGGLPAERVVRLIGEPDLLSVAAALMRCRAYLGNDSGITHLAAALGVPTLALFGPTEPRHYAPCGPRARVLEAPAAADGMRAMAGIDVAMAEAALVETIAVDKYRV